MQAAVLRVELPHLDDWSDGRRAGARYYQEAGLGELVSLPQATAGAQPAWHLYVVRTPEPDTLGAALSEHGIGARGYYRVATHEQPGMRAFPPTVPLPGTELASRTNLAIPMSPVLSAEQAGEVVQATRSHLAAAAPAKRR